MSRRQFVWSAAALSAGVAMGAKPALGQAGDLPPLEEFPYGAVSLEPGPQALRQPQDLLAETIGVLMELDENSLLRPFRAMAGQPAPGAELGGWYSYNADYDYRKAGDSGFAPGHAFGQWISALSRSYAATGAAATRDRVLRLNRLYADAISTQFFARTRFPAYTFDKLVCGLIDAHSFAGDPEAWSILRRTLDLARPELPAHAIEREMPWRVRPEQQDVTWKWDESYTMPENLFLAGARGAGPGYTQMAQRYLMDESYFDPLAAGEDAMHGKHAYSYVNALCSAMQAWFVLGSEQHLWAAKNGFGLLTEQSFATGGWGPDEMLRRPSSGKVGDSLSSTHNSFETPCGAYAHTKLTRYLLRATRDGRYGDSMERVLLNTLLGVKPLRPDGEAFYYSDYNFDGQRVYSGNRWPCCSGTLPQVLADYHVNTYLRDPAGVWVNLYQPSTLRWQEGGVDVALRQSGNYPLDERVSFDLTAAKAVSFALRLRVPEWAGSAAMVRVNDAVFAAPVERGFAIIDRNWKPGDRVTLDLPLRTRLETVDDEHPELVALLRGPLVLFPLRTEDAAPVVEATRSQLLAARRTGPAEWTVDTASGPMRLLPFAALGEQRYSTYWKVISLA